MVKRSKPNILILMADQLNAGVLGCYGGDLSTPNIDRLAKKGVVFNNAICPTPFCSPSRASMITGLYPHTHGIVHNCMLKDYPTTAELCPENEEGIKQKDITTEKILYNNGYNTHHYGKWQCDVFLAEKVRHGCKVA